MTYEPNFERLVQVAQNKKPDQLPLYEHIIDMRVIATLRQADLSIGENPSAHDLRRRYSHICAFWREMTYDTISFEGSIIMSLVDSGAIFGGREGPIQSMEDLEAYPFEEVERRFWSLWTGHLDTLGELLPDSMRLVGGCGNGPFEIAQDLVGFESLCVLLYEEPELIEALFQRITELMERLWTKMLADYGALFCVGRIGDDLGFKTNTMLSPALIRQYLIPIYRQLIAKVHATGKPFIMHSCGCIFSVMDDLIAAGIDAKHSNEDQIAPYDEWIDRYGGRIGLLGGVDVDRLCQTPPNQLHEELVAEAARHRRNAHGYALGSGNSIADYVPAEGFLAMVEAAKRIRREEAAGSLA